jgi:hypothetical protein
MAHEIVSRMHFGEFLTEDAVRKISFMYCSVALQIDSFPTVWIFFVVAKRH